MAIDNGYCTLAELKAVLRITDSVDDNLLERRIEEASRVIDNHCGRRFYRDGQASARVFAAIDDSFLQIDDISDSAGVIVKIDTNGDGTYDRTLTATEYQLEPLNCFANERPATSIRAAFPGLFPLTKVPPAIQITAKWGWHGDAPYPIRSACIILAGRLVKRGDSLLGVAGFGDLGAITVRAIDPDVERMLKPFKIMAVA